MPFKITSLPDKSASNQVWLRMSNIAMIFEDIDHMK